MLELENATATKFGVGILNGLAPQADTPGELASSWTDYVTLAEIAERLDFDSIWVSEHHQAEQHHWGAPLMCLAAMASRTTRIQLGTAVLIAPLHHPLRLATDVAALQALSGGRCVLGMGMGYRSTEFAAFGVDRHQRAQLLENHLRVLPRLLAGQVVTDLDAGQLPSSLPESPSSSYAKPEDIGAWVTPSMVEVPPLLVGGYSDRAVMRAAELADGLVLGRGRPDDLERWTRLLWHRLEEERAQRFKLVVGQAFLALDGPVPPERVRQAHAAQEDLYARWLAAETPTPTTTSVRSGTPGAQDFDFVGDTGQILDHVRSIVRLLDGFPDHHIILRVVFPGLQLQEMAAILEHFRREVLAPIKGQSPDENEGVGARA